MAVKSTDVVVIDNGTGLVKAGFASDNLPRFVFPSMVGRPVLRAEEDVVGDVELKDVMIGDEAVALRKALEITYPVTEGVIKNWSDMELVWSYLFETKMGGFDPAGKHVLLTEAPLNPRKNTERMAQVMFETYKFGAMQVGVQALMTLYAQGRDTGVVLDSGDGVTHVVAVYDQ